MYGCSMVVCVVGISGIVRPNVPKVNINSGSNSGAGGFDYLGTSEFPGLICILCWLNKFTLGYSTDIGQFGFVTRDELGMCVGHAD